MDLTDKKKYQLLIEISHKLRDTLDLDTILEHLLDTIKTVIDYDAAGIFVLNQDLIYGKGSKPKEMIAKIIHRGFDPRPTENDPMLTLGKGIIGYVIFTGASLIVPDVHKDARYVEARNKTKSEIAVPIIRGERAIGAFNLESDRVSAYDESDLEVLLFFADVASVSIEKAMLHRQLLEKEIIDKQLQLAKDVQSRLLPNESPQIIGYDIAGVCMPAEEIGGDYYDFIRMPQEKLGIALADISGHGIASAMMMSAFRGMLRMHAHGRLEPAKIARIINRLLPEFTGDSHFITAVYIVFNITTDVFTYVCCGHHPPLLLHSDGSIKYLDMHGPALGIMRHINYPTEKLSIVPGDIMVLYTDGVVEITNPDGIEFGIERLNNVLQQSGDLPAAEMIKMIIRATQKFSMSLNYADDFTLVIIKRV